MTSLELHAESREQAVARNLRISSLTHRVTLGWGARIQRRAHLHGAHTGQWGAHAHVSFAPAACLLSVFVSIPGALPGVMWGW